MDNYELIYTAKKIATDIPTRYQLGGWGEQSNGIYLFDCVCLIKSILWGFNFSVGGHGGAVYLANGVPDINANRMIDICYNVSNDFRNIEIGEILYLPGHTGIYVGDRNVVEATTAWNNKVLISYIGLDGSRIKDGRQVYSWEKHGRLPYINYHGGYAVINMFKVYDIETTSVKVKYEVDLPISEVLYSFDGVNYINLINHSINNLIPNSEYNLRIKVKRKYTDNYTESDVITFKTLDKPFELKYVVGENIIFNGILYNDPYSDIEIMSLTNYISSITNTNNHYGSIHPYQIGNLGWGNEEDIKIYHENGILDKIKKVLILFIPFILLFLLIFLIIIKSIM